MRWGFADGNDRARVTKQLRPRGPNCLGSHRAPPSSLTLGKLLNLWASISPSVKSGIMIVIVHRVVTKIK